MPGVQTCHMMPANIQLIFSLFSVHFTKYMLLDLLTKYEATNNEGTRVSHIVIM